MSVVYSPLCDTDKVAYYAYLAAFFQDGRYAEFLSRDLGSGGVKGCDRCERCDDQRVDRMVGYVGVEGQGEVGRDNAGCSGVDVDVNFGSVVDETIKHAGEGFSSNHVGGGRCVDVHADGDVGVSKHGVGAAAAGVSDASAEVGGVSATGRGKWYWHNKKKKVNAKLRRSNWRVPDKQVYVGRCETVLSGVSEKPPSYLSALSDAEKLAKESLARRRAAENAVAEKLAKMKLESLEDEKKCQEYADLKRQRVIQWQNEALAKSQASLDKCKSIDPGSSSSQYEIRRQAKENEDLKYERKLMIEKFSAKYDAGDVADIVSECRAPGEGTLNELDLLAAHWAPNSCSSVDPGDCY